MTGRSILHSQLMGGPLRIAMPTVAILPLAPAMVRGPPLLYLFDPVHGLQGIGQVVTPESMATAR